MIREDRELLTELARLNTDMAPFAMRVMDGSASAAEQAHYAQRLIAAVSGCSAGPMRPMEWS